jgi:nuclear receptor subfamily 1 group F protein 4
VCVDPVQISELLAKTIGDAHSRTCLFSGEHIADMLRKPQDISKVHYYKNMVSGLFSFLRGSSPHPQK